MGTSWTIRKAVTNDAAGIARVHIDIWRTTYKGIVQDEYLESLSYKKREERWRNTLAKNPDGYCVFVAENSEGQIIGFADGGPERTGDFEYDGELYAIYLLQEYQRRGIGKQLFGHVVSHLASNNCHGLIVWVLTDNPSRMFYESLGGQLVRNKIIGIGNQHLNESAYGWRNLTSLQAEITNQ